MFHAARTLRQTGRVAAIRTRAFVRFQRRKRFKCVRQKTLAHVGLVLLLLTAAVLGCDRNPPTAPSTPVSQSPPPPPPPSAPVPIRVDISGPGSVAPGETAQYTATASFADGSTRDVTKEAVWHAQSDCCPVPPTPVLTVSADGIATGLNPGEVFLSVSLGTRSFSSFSKWVLVLPAGTFRHHGFVYDDGVGVPDARVTVTEGSAAGLATMTNNLGQYRLYGVSGSTDVSVTKPGYVEQKQELTVTRNHQTLVFHLALSARRDDVGGTYTMTVTAAPECASKLPAEARERKYEAVLTQAGPRVTATLQGAPFYTSGDERYNTFRGAVLSDRLTFWLSGGNYYYPGPADMLEQLTASTYFSMWGSVVLTGSSARRSGTLDGEIEIVGAPPRYDRIAWCASTAHRFELTR